MGFLTPTWKRVLYRLFLAACLLVVILDGVTAHVQGVPMLWFSAGPRWTSQNRP
jgi:hypothetical protein